MLKKNIIISNRTNDIDLGFKQTETTAHIFTVFLFGLEQKC